MNPLIFKQQVERLRNRFGLKAFDEELIKLIWREVREMSDAGFVRYCDVLIGSRTPHKPPLIAEFREARLAEEKIRFQNTTIEASKVILRKAPEEMRAHLKQVLSQEFGKVDSAHEAHEIARIRQLIKPENEPA